MLRLIRELVRFIVDSKRYVLVPIVLAIVIVGVLGIVAASTPALSPFIYPLF